MRRFFLVFCFLLGFVATIIDWVFSWRIWAFGKARPISLFIFVMLTFP